MPFDPSEPWEPWDDPPAPRRQARDRRAAGRRRTRTAIGVAVGLFAVVGGTALAVGWPDGGGSGASSAAQTSPIASGAPTAASGTEFGVPPGAKPVPADGLPGTAANPTTPGPPQMSGAPVPAPGGQVPTAPGAQPLAGKTIVIDPGHNPGNIRHTTEIGREVEAGGFTKNCDETGTETNAGYTEAEFTLDVAHRARQVLTELGAKVVFTWDNDRPWGPCVDERARIGNEARADAVVSIHGDGGPSSGTGFHVIVPALVRTSTADTGPILAPSRSLGDTLAQMFAQVTGTRPANYIGTNGIALRDDLGGLNLSTVPKVFIECGNMRNSGDAGRMTDAQWRQLAAQGIAFGIRDFLTNPTKGT